MGKKYTKTELLEYLELKKLSPAEERFFDHDFRQVINFGETRPTASSDNILIHASFLREVILGNVEGIDLPEDGLKIKGAWVKGVLDLNFCKFSKPIIIGSSHFSQDISLVQSQFPLLDLNNSEWQSLIADRIKIGGSAFLNHITAHGEVRFLGAEIGGQFSSQHASYLGKEKSLNADGIKIGGSAFLNHITAHGEVRFLGAEIGSNFESQNANYLGKEKNLIADGIKISGDAFLERITAQGEVRFLGAEIGGQFSSQNANYLGKEKNLIADGIKISGDAFLNPITAQGEVRFLGAEIKGQLNCRYAKIKSKLSLQNASIGDTSFFPFKEIGGLNLDSAKLNKIIDDKSCWPSKGKLILDGASYQGFTGYNTPNDAASRLEWLSLNHQFSPQPYRQLAKVFRSEGKTRDANQVLYVMEDKLAKNYRDEFDTKRANGIATWQDRASLIADKIFKSVTGYGYKNYKALIWLFSLIGIMWFFSFTAYHLHQMVPNSDVILTSAHYLVLDDPIEWANTMIEGQDWESFNALFYAADVVVPLIDFSQEDTWSPSPARGAWGETVWFLRWPFKIMGWIVATIGLASMTGFLQTRHNE